MITYRGVYLIPALSLFDFQVLKEKSFVPMQRMKAPQIGINDKQCFVQYVALLCTLVILLVKGAPDWNVLQLDSTHVNCESYIGEGSLWSETRDV